jgi:hypothetical protein
VIARLGLGRKEDYTPAVVRADHRFRHMFLAGSTGSGKSNLLKRFWWMDSLIPVAKVLIDPSGALAGEAYSMSRKAVYCSLSNPQVGLNPMTLPYHPNDIVDIIIESINQVISVLTKNVELTARMRSILTDTVIWCIEHNRLSLEQVVEKLNVMQQHHETRQGVIDRLMMFIQDARMKKIICELPPVDWDSFINNKQTLVMDCHGMSEDKMIFAGTLLAQQIKTYFRFTKKKEYKPLVLYVDEAHNFINENFFNLLREGRKYKVSSILATTDFANMNPELIHTILSNVGTLISFRCGFQEAVRLSKEFKTLSTEDVQFVEKHHCCYRTPDDEGIAKTSKAPSVKVKPVTTISVVKDSSLKWFPIRKSCPSQDDSEHQNGSSLKLTGKKPKSRCAEGTASESDGNSRVEKTTGGSRTRANAVS